MHIYLTGFMGAGKSTVGRALAKLLDRPFVDLDETIESAQGATLTEIFEEQGEMAFRRIESGVLRAVDNSHPAVVATGGGAVTVSENCDWMKSQGTTVWLDAPFELILERMSAENLAGRPLFENATQARGLYGRRRHEYGDSDIRIEVSSSHSAAEVAALIRDRLEERECAT
jgi:shikimate kinase